MIGRTCGRRPRRTALRRCLTAGAALAVVAGGCSPGGGPGVPTPTSTTSTTSTTAPPGQPPNAWEVPASQIPTSPRSDDWAERLYFHADRFDRNFSIEFGLDAPSNDYSIPVYSTADATTNRRVFRRPPEQWNGHWDVEVGSSIPWNPSWRPSDGFDGYIAIVDPATGREWNIWAISSPEWDPVFLDQGDCLDDDLSVERGYDPEVHLCAAAVMIVRRPDGQVADTRTYRGNYPPPAGAGVHGTRGLVTPEEVASGAIRHAMRFMTSSSNFGPPCPPEVTSPDDPRVGTVCGIAVAPVSKHERAFRTAPPEEMLKTTPHGLRFVVDLTDERIEAWLDSRGYAGRLRETARIFAVALRDYGLIQTDGTGGPALIQAAGGRNPEIAAGWRALGIVDDGAHLLDGLITSPSDLRVLAPPVNHCSGVLTTRACWASDSTYG